MTRHYIQLLGRTLPDAAAMDVAADFEGLGVDSFDLLSIRVEFERFLNAEIADRDWTEFRSFADLFAYCDRVGSPSAASAAALPSGVGLMRQFEIGMPQMAVGSLSENWLFKELGDAHWEMLCRGLDRKSSELTDEMDNRLYATFARVQIRGTASLAEFNESEPASLGGEIARYGKGMYFSKLAFASRSVPEKRVEASLITSFSRRGDAGNKNLVKSHPDVAHNQIANVTDLPAIVDEYRLIKKGELKNFALLDYTFQLSNDTIWEYRYSINPYYDINGASLLYFASYPTISDYCMFQYCRQHQSDFAHSLEQFHTIARDVMYYANCDVHDGIVFKLHHVRLEGDSMVMATSLHRESDSTLMARVFTIKRFVAPPSALR